MANWAERAVEAACAVRTKNRHVLRSELTGIVRETIEEAARRCRSRYLHGEAGIAAGDCAQAVEAMLTDDGAEAGGG